MTVAGGRTDEIADIQISVADLLFHPARHPLLETSGNVRVCFHEQFQESTQSGELGIRNGTDGEIAGDGGM